MSILFLLYLDRSPLVRDERLPSVHGHSDLAESAKLHLLLLLTDRGLFAVTETGNSQQLSVNCLLPGLLGSVLL